MKACGKGAGMDKIRSVKKRKIDPDKVFDIVNLLIMLVLLVIFVWPLWFVLIASISDPSEVWQGHVVLFPRGITLAAYEEVIKYKTIWTGYANTILYTVLGTAINMVLTVCGAYPLSRKDFVPKKFFMLLFMVTMYFSGGLIPLFFVIRNTGLYNTIWVSSIPYAISAYNMIIMKTFFESIPESLEEAAKIDGASDMGVLLKIVLPLSVPIIATIGLFYAVQYWNSYFDALIYIQSPDKFTLQLRLRSLLFADELNNAGGGNVEGIGTQVMTQSLKMACVAVSTIPILLVYPWLQKYFVKGVMLGSVKG